MEISAEAIIQDLSQQIANYVVQLALAQAENRALQAQILELQQGESEDGIRDTTS